jgi:hypothetical protein
VGGVGAVIAESFAATSHYRKGDDMRKTIVFAAAISLIVGSGLLGCAEKATSSQDAIEKSKSYEGAEGQAKYLIKQANGFLDSEEFNEAIKTAQYVLRNLDDSSEEAKRIIEESRAELKEVATDAIEDAKRKLGGSEQ